MPSLEYFFREFLHPGNHFRAFLPRLSFGSGFIATPAIWKATGLPVVKISKKVSQILTQKNIQARKLSQDN